MSDSPSKTLFDRLFAEHNDKIYRFAFKLTADHSRAQEITQQCFIRLWENIDQVCPDQDTFPLLFVYARNLVIDNTRKLYREKKMLSEAARHQPPEAQEDASPLMMKEYESQLEKVIERMPEQRKAVYLLSRRLGYTHKEIADRLCISPATVKNHLTIALQFIRRELLQYYDMH